MNQNSMIDTPLLRQLVRHGKAGSLIAKGVAGGFLVVIRDGLDEQLLEAQRGHARKFKKLESVANYLNGLGARGFSVELDQWSEKSLSM
jgi:hypothetical protein